MAKAERSIVTRLARIEGQVRGIANMVEDDRYCIDILTQLAAVRSALLRVEAEILKGHADTCVADAIKSGNAKDQKRKFSELVELFTRVAR